jgi:uncharacterized protein with GYD domain
LSADEARGHGSTQVYKGGDLPNEQQSNRGTVTMLFCITAQYTPQAVNAMLDDPTINRGEAVKKLVETAGGKLVAMYSYGAEGPGVMAIFEVPEPSLAASILGVAVAGGAIHNVKLVRLLTQDEVAKVRQKASQIRSAYKVPGK